MAVDRVHGDAERAGDTGRLSLTRTAPVAGKTVLKGLMLPAFGKPVANVDRPNPSARLVGARVILHRSV